MEIVGWMGERYGEKVKGWWFDSACSLDPRGPHNSVTTDMTGFQFPWERFTVAAKVGHPARLKRWIQDEAKNYFDTTKARKFKLHNFRGTAMSTARVAGVSTDDDAIAFDCTVAALPGVRQSPRGG
jgi:hypothetical protein